MFSVLLSCTWALVSLGRMELSMRVGRTSDEPEGAAKVRRNAPKLGAQGAKQPLDAA